MKATQCPQTQFFYVTGYRTGRKYWGHTAQAAQDLARLYFYA